MARDLTGSRGLYDAAFPVRGGAAAWLEVGVRRRAWALGPRYGLDLKQERTARAAFGSCGAPCARSEPSALSAPAHLGCRGVLAGGQASSLGGCHQGGPAEQGEHSDRLNGQRLGDEGR